MSLSLALKIRLKELVFTVLWGVLRPLRTVITNFLERIFRAKLRDTYSLIFHPVFGTNLRLSSPEIDFQSVVPTNVLTSQLSRKILIVWGQSKISCTNSPILNETFILLSSNCIFIGGLRFPHVRNYVICHICVTDSVNFSNAFHSLCQIIERQRTELDANVYAFSYVVNWTI